MNNPERSDNQPRQMRVITEADLPEVARLAARHFGGLDLGKMLEIAAEAAAIDGEFTVIEPKQGLVEQRAKQE